MLVASALSVTTWGGGRVDVFAIGTGGTLYHKGGIGNGWYNAAWDNLGNPRLPLTAVSAASWGPGRVDVFAVGSNATTYHKWGTPPSAWQQPSWDNLGGTLVSPPTAISEAVDTLDTFGIGADGGVWHIAWNAQAQWSAWNISTPQSNLGCPGGVSFTGAVSAIAITGGMTVFGLGSDGNIWAQAGGSAMWLAQWTPLPYPPNVSFQSNPAAVSWGGARMDVVCIGTDGHMYHNWSANGVGGFAGWELIGGLFISDPCIVSRGANLLDLFGIGQDGALYHNSWNGSKWQGWTDDLGVPPGLVFVSAPSAVTATSTSLDVFGLASDGSVYHKASQNGVWQPAWDTLGGQVVVEEPPQNIGVRMQFQQTNEWCWVAVGVSILKFYDPTINATQAGLVTYYGPTYNQFPPGTVCFPPPSAIAANPLIGDAMDDPYAPTALVVLDGVIPAICVHSGGVDTVFGTYGALAGTPQDSLTVTQIQAQLNQGRPIAVGLTFNGGGAHTVAIVGAVDNLLLISDPAAGESVIQAQDFPSQYGGGASQPVYFLTQPPTTTTP